MEFRRGRRACVIEREPSTRTGTRIPKHSPLTKGAKAEGLGGCPGKDCEAPKDNPLARCASPFVKGD
jgi:hypothetical protein